MTPSQQLQKMLGEVVGYDGEDIVSLLPLVAALQGALHTRLLALGQQTGMPDTDYLLSTEEVATRLGRSTKWVRENAQDLPFAIRMRRGHRFSAHGLEEWISEQRADRMPSALPPTRRQHER